MSHLFRWLFRLFIAVSVLSVGAVGLAYYLASRSLPDYNHDYKVSGTVGPVEIVRDSHDVPHIFVEHDQDAYFGLGFAHAQDRLWQMTMLRRTSEGRLSEFFGKRTLAIDGFLRQLDIHNLAEQSFQYQDARTKKALTSYAAGVNAWLDIVRTRALGRGAPEFFLFSRKIRPWVPADSLAILRLMALKLSGHLSAEVLRARVSLAIGDVRLQDILPEAPGPGAAALPKYSSLFPESTKYAALGPSAPHDPLDPVPDMQMAGASNAWAAGPSRTASGGTLLANDPHLAFSAPAIWMLARLQLSTGDVIGGTIPGMPLILTGRSPNLAWGVTSSYLDDADLHVEKLNPKNDAEYLTPDGFKPFRLSKTRINVKGAEPVDVRLRWTQNGPVIPSDLYDIKTILPPGHVMSLSWTALDAEDRSMTAALNLMRAHGVTQAIKAVKDFKSPSQNLTLIDKNSIALQMIGKMPNRPAHHQSQGRIPTPGWLAENRWRGYLPYENNPRFINPIGGLVANTNNKIVDRPFPNHVSFVWGDTQRIERLSKLLNSRKVHTRASFVEIQTDQVSFSARSLLPLIARDLWFPTKVARPGSPEEFRQRALALLANWNGEMNEHMPEPLIYAAWMRHLQKKLIQDEIGPLADKFTHPDPVFLERVYRNTDGASVWCDVVQSTPVETCTEIARAALDAAILELGKTYGPAIEAWRWGDAHQALQDHKVLGKIPVLSWFVNIHQSTSGGDNTLMRGKTISSGPNPYANVHGAAYRGVYDFADPDSSVFIISTGQSGHFLSRHYDDLARLWRRGDYIPMSLSPKLARAASLGTSHLTPKR